MVSILYYFADVHVSYLEHQLNADTSLFVVTKSLRKSFQTHMNEFILSQIWIAPEGKEFQNSFKTLRKLFLHGIYAEFDLLWTLILLESAPSVQIFGIKVPNFT